MNCGARLVCACLMCVPVVGGAAGLDHARDYEIVSEISSSQDHNGRGWYIVSDADSSIEFLETAMSAALDLHDRHGAEFITVILVPRADLVHGPRYASINYSALGRGARALGPRHASTKWLWRGLVAERVLTPHEMRVAELWQVNQQRFPQTNHWSSWGFDHDALVGFIANELGVSPADAELPQLPMTLIERRE